MRVCDHEDIESGTLGMSARQFTGNFTQQEAIPEAGIDAAVGVLRSGRLHRYNAGAGETPPTSALERAYADWQGADFCLATASGGQALQIAMRAAGVTPGDTVLTNAFTLAPVPGAIAAVGASPVFVETTEVLRIDFDDLAAKADKTGAKYLLLSHMRGHLCDMERLMECARGLGLTVIEDCAHTMGARWDGVRSGNHGLAGCFSTQTYKHINSGEGGLLTSNDPEFMARAIMLSGSYMLYARHGAAPDEKYFATARLETPNASARLDNLRAAILLPQLAALEQNVERWNERYAAADTALRRRNEIVCIDRPEREEMVGSSIQFRVPRFDAATAKAFVDLTASRGVELKWFGAPEPHGFTSTYTSWTYAPPQSLPRSDAIFATLFDMRLPLTFSVDDCQLIGDIIGECVAELCR